MSKHALGGGGKGDVKAETVSFRLAKFYRYCSFLNPVINSDGRGIVLIKLLPPPQNTRCRRKRVHGMVSGTHVSAQRRPPFAVFILFAYWHGVSSGSKREKTNKTLDFFLSISLHSITRFKRTPANRFRGICKRKFR